MIRRIGVTGTEAGSSPEQLIALRAVLRGLSATGVHILHMGECIGVDDEANTIARQELGMWTVGHPPLDQKKWADCKVDDRRPPEEYLARDRTMAATIDLLIAVPRGFKLNRRSGVTATVNYAEEYGKIVLFIWPDGLVTTERLH